MWLALLLVIAVIIFFVIVFFAWYFTLWKMADDPIAKEINPSILSNQVDRSLSPNASKIIDFKDLHDELEDSQMKLLHSGYPICKDSVCVYDSRTMKPHLKSYIPPRTNKPRSHNIPAKIFQGFNHSVLDDDYYRHISHTLELNPNYEYHFHDTISAQKLIRENFEPRVLQAYNDLVPGAYRGDLWRLCALYIHGGVYMDLKLVPFLSFDELIDPQTDLVLAVEKFGFEYSQASIGNGFIAATPRHMIIKKYIEEIVNRVEARYYGRNPWDITGPRVFATVALESLECDWPVPSGYYPGYGRIQAITARWYNDQSIYFGKVRGIKLRSKATGNKTRFAEMTSSKPYNVLWKEKKVYREKS